MTQNSTVGVPAKPKALVRLTGETVWSRNTPLTIRRHIIVINVPWTLLV